MTTLSPLLCRLAVCVLAAVASLSSAAAMPPVFVDLSVDAAKKKAAEDDRFVVIDAMAEWCGPCKAMDHTTWVDPDVVAWLEEHAVAIQLDVDKNHADARAFSIRAMPTIIILKDGEEFDRYVGFMNARTMLPWFEGLKQGKRFPDTRRDRAAFRMDADGNVDVQHRYQIAQELLSRSLWSAATDEYTWLWDNMHEFDPEHSPVRLAMMTDDLKKLAAEHKPARITFQVRRDKYAQFLRRGTGSFVSLNNWIVLNAVLGDEDDTLAWIDRIKDREGSDKTFARVWDRIDSLLLREKRYADYGAIIPNPVAHTRQRLHIWKAVQSADLRAQLPDDARAELDSIDRDRLIDELALLHASLLLAARHEEATTVADDLFEAIPGCDPRLQLADRALQLGVATDQHLGWLDACDERRAADMRRRLQTVLESVNDAGR